MGSRGGRSGLRGYRRQKERKKKITQRRGEHRGCAEKKVAQGRGEFQNGKGGGAGKLNSRSIIPRL
jgi:hypothetical protein